MAILTKLEAVKTVLRTYRNIAVLGAHVKEHKAAHYVPRYLQEQGYSLYPVNPAFAGDELWGHEVVPTLGDLPCAVELVNVFRRSEHLPGHLSDMLAMTPLPNVVWLQLGIRHDRVAEKLSAAGIDVIQNRCMLADHQRLL